ncbi:MBL fold metallo-hydrolase [Enterococcus rivorum]
MIRRMALVIIVSLVFIIGIFSICKMRLADANKEAAEKNQQMESELDDFKNKNIENILYTDDVFSIRKLTKDTYVYTAYGEFNGQKYPANGLILVGNSGLILIDTPWDDKKTRDLLAILKNTFHKNVSDAIVTHFHNDRVGGIKALQEEDISVHSTPLTDMLAVSDGYAHSLGDLSNNDF